MSNLNYTLSKIYNNLFIYFNYKNEVPLDNQIEDSEFIKNIFNNEYFIITTVPHKYNKEQINIIKENINNSKFSNNSFQVTYYIIFHYNSELYTNSRFKKSIN